jgi:glycine/D-amino acid oxidase-like deaminating enzyme
MTTYDWIVIGAGITGSALSYELAKAGFRVLLLEKEQRSHNATYCSYGGLAYWSGTDELTRQLCREGIEIHRNLSQELESYTEFRELDLILTIPAQDDPKAIANNYTHFAIAPELLSVDGACEREPLLNSSAISGALRFPHAHIDTQKTNLAYQKAFRRLGGEIKIERAIAPLQQGNNVRGVVTTREKYAAANTVVCAGGLSRALLKAAGIDIPLYFTHAQLIKTPPVDLSLRTIVMPAVQHRLELEQKATQAEHNRAWEQPSSELLASILDAGAVQFLNKSFCIGQISEIRTAPDAKIDAVKSENLIRSEVGKVLPALENLPGTWHNCLVAFTKNSRPLIGASDRFSGIHLFSGFTSTLVFAPPLAKHFASWATDKKDQIMTQLGQIF